MKNLNYLLLTIVSLISTSIAFAQNGTIRGTVIDGGTGEPIIGATVVLKETTTGGVTDLDGKFEIKADPGIYDLQASFISYQPVTITGVEMKADEVTVIDQIMLNESVEQLAEVVITAEVVRTNEAALMTVKRKSANLVDGISSAAFKTIGDNDAAGAIKRVTGVTIEGGKYVYVRGLGDRYTKTMLNGVDIPGLDPDKNSLQIDIFPTNLIDNMIVLKTALAEVPADFTGGVVNIETKDFPEERIMEISLGLSYNPSFHFNDNFLTYEGSDTDWMGFDSGTRDLPAGARGDIPLPNGGSASAVNKLTRSFNPTLGASTEKSFMDYSLGASFGNQYDVGRNKLGLVLSGTYKSTRSFYDDLIFGEYQIAPQSDDYELIPATIRKGEQGVENILVGGLAGLAFKTHNSKFKINALHLQNGEQTVGQFFIVDDPEDRAAGKSGFTAHSDNLEYFERSLTNYLISGEHHLNDSDWEIGWRVSPTFSKLQDPDIRSTAFSNEQGKPELNPGQAGLPSRIWRYLDEVNIVGKLDITRNADIFGRDAELKVGSMYIRKERDFEILQYQIAFYGPQPEWEGDPNEILQPENLYPTTGAYYQSGNISPNPNAYNSTIDNLAFYASAELSPLNNLKAIVGLRAEDYVQRHSGRDIRYAQGGDGRNLDDEVVLEGLNFFPSVNLILALNEDQNVRFSYSRTVARPSFKELSFAEIIDPVSNRIFIGGLYEYPGEWDGNLRETFINNIDLRWEYFMPKSQMFSASVFYKSFQDPIELVRIRQAFTSSEFQPRNVGKGTLYGVELEVRKNLDFLSSDLKDFSLNSNVTLVKSFLDMSPTEYLSRLAYEKAGEDIKDNRQMAGQAPYVINTGISYNNFETGLQAGLFYNVQGETLVIVGGGLFPDVYTEPFHSVNFNLNKSFGSEDQFSLNFSVNNILNDVREEFYKGYQAEDQYFTKRAPGTTFGLSIGYEFR